MHIKVYDNGRENKYKSISSIKEYNADVPLTKVTIMYII